MAKMTSPDVANRLKAEGKLCEAIEQYRLHLSREPKNVEAWIQLAQALFEQGDLPAALRAAWRLRETAPNRSLLAYAWLLMGEIHERVGRNVLAERCYRRAVGLKRSADFHAIFAGFLLNTGQVGEAKKHFQRAIRIRPTVAEEPHCGLGLCYEKQGKVALAERHLREAIRLDPDYPEALQRLADIVSRSGRVSEARELQSKALSLDRGNVYYRLGLALILQCLGLRKDAARHFRKALQTAPQVSAVYWSYGFFLASGGRNSNRAETYLRKAVSLGPNDEWAHYYLGKFLCERDRPAEARRVLRKASRLGHADAEKLLARLPRRNARKRNGNR